MIRNITHSAKEPISQLINKTPTALSGKRAQNTQPSTYSAHTLSTATHSRLNPNAALSSIKGSINGSQPRPTQHPYLDNHSTLNSPSQRSISTTLTTLPILPTLLSRSMQWGIKPDKTSLQFIKKSSSSMSEVCKQYKSDHPAGIHKALSDKLHCASSDNHIDYSGIQDDRHRPLPNATKRDNAPYLDHIFDVAEFAHEIDLGPIQQGFHQVTQDPYVTDGCRYKNIARYRIYADRVEPAEHGPMFQSAEFNPINGDITRHYDEIPTIMRDDPGFHQVIRTFAERAHLPEGDEVIIHAQRTLAQPGVNAFPTVEGWHQDGLDVIGIFCAARHNIVGAENFLALQKGTDIFLRGTLEEGELVLISDQDVFHFVSPFKAADPTKVAYRDAIIITTPSMRPKTDEPNPQ